MQLKRRIVQSFGDDNKSVVQSALYVKQNDNFSMQSPELFVGKSSGQLFAQFVNNGLTV
jgi:hypothetical protein